MIFYWKNSLFLKQVNSKQFLLLKMSAYLAKVTKLQLFRRFRAANNTLVATSRYT